MITFLFELTVVGIVTSLVVLPLVTLLLPVKSHDTGWNIPKTPLL